MAPRSIPAYRFGDLLALARQSWLVQMAEGLRAMGYPDYRRSDALVLRLLSRGQVSIGRLGDALGVTRQAARKVAGGLERRGFAGTARDPDDARQVNVSLTPEGKDYAVAVASVIDRLNRELSRRVRPTDLAAADTVLRAVLTDNRTRTLAAYLASPGHDDNS
ncbi:MAG: MarR family winged helix-turn-helix transcriptional regulator [Jatrophihabitantaceae bacterium]